MAKSLGKAQLPKLPDGRVDLLSVLEEGYEISPRAKDGKLKTFLEYKDMIQTSLQKGYTRQTVLDAMKKAGLMTASYQAFNNYVRTRLGNALVDPVSVVAEDQMSEQERRLLGKGMPQAERRKPVDDSHVKYG